MHNWYIPLVSYCCAYQAEFMCLQLQFDYQYDHCSYTDRHFNIIVHTLLCVIVCVIRLIINLTSRRL